MTSLSKDCMLTDEDFSTATCVISAVLNSRPISKLSDDPDDIRTLSPAQLMSGVTDATVDPSQFLDCDGYRRSYKMLREAVNIWWYKWQRLYLSTLQQRQKWHTPARNLKIGDLVLMVEPKLARGHWLKAMVTQTFPDKWGVVRKVQVRTAKKTFFQRDVRKLVLLEETTD